MSDATVNGFRGCWSCGAHGPCFDDCECAKCVDPEGYENWRAENPDEYDAWLERQRLDEGEHCDCPSCQANGGGDHVPTTDPAAIRVEQAEIRTATVTIKTMTVNRRQVTLSLFRQLLGERLVDVNKGEFNGLPWGTVNYHGTKDCGRGRHLHVVWQKNDELRRACEHMPGGFEPWIDGADEWLLIALDEGWRPERWGRDYRDGATFCDVRFAADVDASVRCWLDRRTTITAFLKDASYEYGRLELAEKAAKAREAAGMTRAELAENIADRVRAEHDTWLARKERWAELEALPQLFIGA